MSKNIFISILFALALLSGGCQEKKNDDLTLGLAALAFNIANTVATPTFSPEPGNQTSNANITISSRTSGATIYYTTDGSSPNPSSTQYTSPIESIWTLTGKTIKAFAVKGGMTKSRTITGVFSLPPLKTGQTAVYGTGDNGTNPSGIERGYTDNGNGTVTDNATGLVWQKCSRGQNNDATCSGSALLANWTNAVSYCTGLSLESRTWRLPTRQELETLLNYGTSNPAIDTTFYPSTVIGPFHFYWTSSTSAQNLTDAWLVSFNAGITAISPKFSNNYVRCVSGPTKEYYGSFTDYGNGTVKDNSTGLIWQKCSLGQNNDGNCTGTAAQTIWYTAVSYCTGLNLANRTWRLPTINELRSIVDTTKNSTPAIDTNFFPSTVSDEYWTSTTSALDTTQSWYADFNGADIATEAKTLVNYVRCVSGP